MKKVLALAAMSTALFAGSASADIYIGAGVGETRPSRDDASWKVYAGMQLMPMLGFELTHYEFGTHKSSGFDAWSAAVVGTLAINRDWSVLGKAGIARLQTDRRKDTSPLLGVGVSYAFTGNFSMRIEYEDLGKNDEFDLGDESIKNMGLSLRFLF